MKETRKSYRDNYRIAILTSYAVLRNRFKEEKNEQRNL